MRKLSFVLFALVGTMIIGLPLQSYADPQLDILLNIATQARDNLSLTISQTSNVSDEIKQLFKQGSDETDQLAQAVNQQDAQSAKQHFLAAMKFFKETNDKINSLSTPTLSDQQAAQIAQLKSEINRLDKMEMLLKNIAEKNNINVDFTKFDQLIQTARSDLNAGNIDDATSAIKAANDFLVETHNSLTSAAEEIASTRAKDFTEKQIERFSKMNEINPTTTAPITVPSAPPTPPENPPTIPENTTAGNVTSSNVPPPTPPPLSPPPPENPPTIPENTTAGNVTSPVTKSVTAAVQNYPNITPEQTPAEMIAELKKLVSEGKVDEALKIIKMLEAYQREKLRVVEHEGEQSSFTTSPNLSENTTNNTSSNVPPPTPPPLPPTPPENPPTIPENTTAGNVTSSNAPPSSSITNPPPITPPPTMHGDNEKYHQEKKSQRHNQGNDNNQGHGNVEGYGNNQGLVPRHD